MRSGGSVTPLGIVLALFIVLCGAAAAGPYSGGKSKEAAPEAVIVGTVFRDPGFALPGASVTLAPDPDPSQTAPRKARKQRAITSPRGEFVFHVPAAPMRYTISASANGFKSEHKSVTVAGEGRTDVTLTLTQESKKQE
jgi:hypothetical protein